MNDQFGNVFNYDKIGPTIIWAKTGEKWYYIRGKRVEESYYFEFMNSKLCQEYHTAPDEDTK